MKKFIEKYKRSSEVRAPDSKITKANIEEHKSEVLNIGRRMARPLQLPGHKIAIISTVIGLLLIGGLVGSSAYAVYKAKSYNNFVYQISRLIPFPAAKIDDDFVEYEDYLFELRQLTHYYENQDKIVGGQPVDFDSKSGQTLLANLEAQALKRAKLNTIILETAKANDVSVPREKIQERIDEFESLYGNESRLRGFLEQSFGWPEREALQSLARAIEVDLLKLEILPYIDEASRLKAQEALSEIKSGADFAEVAKKYSEDSNTKNKGGSLGLLGAGQFPFEDDSFEQVALSLDVGGISDVIHTEEGFHIIKVDEKIGDQLRVSHILIRFGDVDEQLDAKLKQSTVEDYIEVKKLQADEEDLESEQ